MMDFLQAHQLNIMLALTGICGAMAVMLYLTKALSRRRRIILMLLEVSAMFLLYFDRLAYLYRGDTSSMGYVMVRVSNFVVFFLTSEILLGFNMYLRELLLEVGNKKTLPKRLTWVSVMAIAGMGLVVVSQFTGLYYTFDENNYYHRAPAFVVCYLIPIIGPLIQFTVIRQYRRLFGKWIYYSLCLFTVGPIIAAVVQFFAYGLSLTNIAMVVVVMLLYIFAYMDINEAVEQAHKLEIANLEEEKKKIYHLVDQVLGTFINALDARYVHTQGHSERVAHYARRIAKLSGKTERETEAAFFAAFVHDMGNIWMSDRLMMRNGVITEEDEEKLRRQPAVGSQILSAISDYPELAVGAHYHRERYDGTGYPEGLKGEEIPELARMIAVADMYDNLLHGNGEEGTTPLPVVREELIKAAGTALDPNFTNVMIHLMELDSGEVVGTQEMESGALWENEFSVGSYREHVLAGVPLSNQIVRIRMRSVPENVKEGEFSETALVVFDSYDGRVHEKASSIERNRYVELGEIWFDGHFVCTRARNMTVTVSPCPEAEGDEEYEIVAGGYRDHYKIRIRGDGREMEAVIALPENVNRAFIGLTGEHRHLRNIIMEKTDREVKEGDITRIAEPISYIRRLESDLKNIQIDGARTNATPGIAVKDRLRICFHAQSLPAADFIWNCPYLILFHSEDGLLQGENYKEYAVVRLNGEKQESGEFSENMLMVEKTAEFSDWEGWKQFNRQGYECKVSVEKSGNRIRMITQNGGIMVRNTTAVLDKEKELFVAITGDCCAITDIRIM